MHNWHNIPSSRPRNLLRSFLANRAAFAHAFAAGLGVAGGAPRSTAAPPPLARFAKLQELTE
jgi:hypothetical protein